MKQFFKMMLASMTGFVLAIFVFFFLAIMIISGMVMGLKSDKEVTVRDQSVLEITLDRPIPERSSDNPFEDFDFSSFSSKQSMGLDDILKNIEKAAKDDRIKGIFLNLTSVQSGMANLEEIRNALLTFKDSKKFIYAYSEYYTQGGYYLSSVADSIFIHPEGGMDFRGLRAELMFFKGTLAKLELEPQVIRHGKFKSAVEPFVNDKMSPENREQIRTFVDGIWKHFLAQIGASRKIDPAAIQVMADEFALRDPAKAAELKIVDAVVYYDQVMESLRRASGLEKENEKIRFVALSKYDNAQVKSDKTHSSQKIAVVYAVGDIVSGKGSEQQIGSETISEAIRKARLDTNVKAIVLRVNSPGGSALASDVIWREAVLAKKAKPLVVSMGNYAASGGYYISCAADTIVAQPNTLTGSIGVFGLLLNAQKMFNNKLGITFDTVKTARYADLGTISRPLTGDERALIQEEIEKIYDTFISHVAEGRRMEKSAVDQIGEGRIWSGTDALRLGLVDKLGGLNTAIDVAAGMAGLENYRITSLPEQKEFLQKLMEDLNSEVRTYFVRNELGENYTYYHSLQQLLNNKGIQARIPYTLEIY